MSKMMDMVMQTNKQVMDTMVAMRNMQHENQMLSKQMLELTREKLDGTIKREEQEMQGDGDTRRKMMRPRAVRPIIEEGVDDFSWNLFLDKWQRYKQAVGAEHRDEICAELRECCSPEVNRMLFEYIGAKELNSNSMDEAILLNHIKTVAVRSIHREVHRYHFNQITQGESEKVSKFVGRLNAQAILCDFNVECSCRERVSYAEEMVAQRLTSGAANPEHMTKVLGEAEDLKTLKQKVDRMISLETTEEAASKIRSTQPSHANPMKSSMYKRGQKQKLVDTSSDKKNNLDEESTDRVPRRDYRRSGDSRRPNNFRRSSDIQTRRCRGCGRSSHPNGKSMSRVDCPAWGQKCRGCNVTGHFEKVCARRSRASFAGGDGSASGEDFLTDCETEDEYWSEIEAEDTTCNSAARSADFRRDQPPEPHG